MQQVYSTHLPAQSTIYLPQCDPAASSFCCVFHSHAQAADSLEQAAHVCAQRSSAPVSCSSSQRASDCTCHAGECGFNRFRSLFRLPFNFTGALVCDACGFVHAGLKATCFRDQVKRQGSKASTAHIATMLRRFMISPISASCSFWFEVFSIGRKSPISASPPARRLICVAMCKSACKTDHLSRGNSVEI